MTVRTAVVRGVARVLGADIAERLAAHGDNASWRTSTWPVRKNWPRRSIVSPSSTTSVALPAGRASSSAGTVAVLVNDAARTEIRSFWEIEPEERWMPTVG